MKPLPLQKIILTEFIDVYSFDTKTTVSVQGKYGTAVLVVLAGSWRFKEMKKSLNRWQKFKSLFGRHKDQYFIRAQRLR